MTMKQPRYARLRSSLRRLALVTPLALLLLLVSAFPTAQAAPLTPSVTIACAATGWGFTITGTGFTGIPSNISGSITIAGTTATFKTTSSGFSATVVPPAPLAGGSYAAKVVISRLLSVTLTVTVPSCGVGGSPGGGGGGLQTPELASGELVAAGVLPILGVLAYRRRRARRVRQDDTAA
jgi:hypothetical protein